MDVLPLRLAADVDVDAALVHVGELVRDSVEAHCLSCLAVCFYWYGSESALLCFVLSKSVEWLALR